MRWNIRYKSLVLVSLLGLEQRGLLWVRNWAVEEEKKAEIDNQCFQRSKELEEIVAGNLRGN